MGRYTSNESRKRLIDAVFNLQKSVKEAADVLNIKYQTALSICRIFSKESRDFVKPKSGAPRKFNSRMKNMILKHFSDDPTSTLKRCRMIIEENRDELGGKVPSLSSIDRILKENRISFKTLQLVPIERNSPSTIEARRKYAINFCRLEGSVEFVFIDEFGCNLALRGCKGRSRIGTRAHIETSGRRGANLSVCAAIGVNGPIFHLSRTGPFNTENFLNFLNSLKDMLNEEKKYVFIMDNVAFHKTLPVQDWFKGNNLKFLYLPPYSPMLNPIEECFSKVKHHIKMAQVENHSGLLNVVKTAFESVSESDCQGWFRHMKQFFPQCLDRQPIMSEARQDMEVEEFNSETDDELLESVSDEM